MAQNITYNSINFQDSNIITKDLSHEDMDNRKVNFQRIGRNGAKIVDDKFGVKVIKVAGTIKDTTKALLDARIDALKAVLATTTDKDLDIDYSTGTRRYLATCTNFKVMKEFYSINTVPFEAEFMVGTPFGKNIDTTTLESLAITTGQNDSFYFYGSMRPLPRIKLTVNSSTAFTSFQFQNKTTGDTVTVTHAFAANDIIIIDCEVLKITLNGTEIDYTGVFPEFENGWNDFYIWFTASAYNVDLKVIYYQLWA
jgi:phage-related protein